VRTAAEVVAAMKLIAGARLAALCACRKLCVLELLEPAAGRVSL
jgi:hypothetical protein